MKHFICSNCLWIKNNRTTMFTDNEAISIQMTAGYFRINNILKNVFDLFNRCIYEDQISKIISILIKLIEIYTIDRIINIKDFLLTYLTSDDLSINLSKTYSSWKNWQYFRSKVIFFISSHSFTTCSSMYTFTREIDTFI